MRNELTYDALWLPLGTVGRAHATRGEVSFRTFNEDSRTLLDLSLPFAATLQDERGGKQEMKVTSVRFVKDHFLLAFEGLADRDAADTLKGRLLWIARSLMPALAAGEFYWQDLVGCQVYDQNGKPLGQMQSVFNTRAHGVGSVISAQGEETLIPLVPAFLLEIDVPGRKLTVERLPEEDLNDAHLAGVE